MMIEIIQLTDSLRVRDLTHLVELFPSRLFNILDTYQHKAFKGYLKKQQKTLNDESVSIYQYECYLHKESDYIGTKFYY